MRNFIREARTEKGMTQQELAESVGVSRQTIISIESGKYVPSTLLALKLSFMLQSAVEELFQLQKNDWND